MDFFDHQARARLNSRRLVFFFVLAVVLTVLVIYLAVAGVVQIGYLFFGPLSAAPSQGSWFRAFALRFGPDGFWNWELLGYVAAVVTSVIALGSGFKMWQLSEGGAAVARLLGGRPVSLNTEAPDEQRLQNVVEEMAIASGLPVPDIYILDEEKGINAFAAGNSYSDAVIGVTFGALKLLTRDELQGVIAHEFSHILNGDMRLNMRLIGWLHGILGLVILGRVLTLTFYQPEERRRRMSKDEPVMPVGPAFHPLYLPVFLIGCACIAAGSIGAFFARLIKAAVSRQREYLADAAAVQFTRNPGGVAGALIKIGGVQTRSIIHAARAEEASHMYFSEGMRRHWWQFTATHPPLKKRILRINPAFDGKYPVVSLAPVLEASRITAIYREHRDKPLDFAKLADVIGAGAAAEELLYAQTAAELDAGHSTAVGHFHLPQWIQPVHLEYAAHFVKTMPEELHAATRRPFSAEALVYGMVCSKEPEERAQQLAEIEQHLDPGLIEEVAGLFPLLEQLDERAYLPLADLCVRALRQLSPGQYERFRANLQHLIEHDSQITLFEYALQRIVVRHLDPHFRDIKWPVAQYYTLKPLMRNCAVLLSGFAQIGHESEEEALNAFQIAATRLASDPALHFLPFSECNLPQIDAAIEKISQASPRLKQQILDALVCAVAADGQVKKREAELLRAIADAFGSPIPPFVRAGNLTAQHGCEPSQAR